MPAELPARSVRAPRYSQDDALAIERLYSTLKRDELTLDDWLIAAGITLFGASILVFVIIAVIQIVNSVVRLLHAQGRVHSEMDDYVRAE